MKHQRIRIHRSLPESGTEIINNYINRNTHLDIDLKENLDMISQDFTFTNSQNHSITKATRKNRSGYLIPFHVINTYWLNQNQSYNKQQTVKNL